MSNAGLNGNGIQFVTLTLKSQGLKNISKQQVTDLLTEIYSSLQNEKDATIDTVLAKFSEKYKLSDEVQAALKKALEEMDKKDTSSKGYITSDELNKESYDLEESEVLGDYIEEQKTKLILDALDEAETESENSTQKATEDNKATTQQQPEKDIEKSNDITKYNDAETKDYMNTKASVTDTSEMPDGFSKCDKINEYKDSDDNHYIKITPSFLKSHVSRLGLSTDKDGNIIDKDGNKVGVTFQNSDGTTSFYLSKEKFMVKSSSSSSTSKTTRNDEAATQQPEKDIEKSNDITKYDDAETKDYMNTKASVTDTSEMPDGFSKCDKINEYKDSDDNHYIKITPSFLKPHVSRLGLSTDKDGNIIDKDGNKVGVTFQNSDGTTSFYLSKEKFMVKSSSSSSTSKTTRNDEAATQQPEKDIEKSNDITKYDDAETKDYMNTKASVTDTSEMPDGFSKCDKINEYKDSDDNHYIKITPSFLKPHVSRLGLSTDKDGNIIDKDGNKVGVTFQNSDGTTSFYLSKEKFMVKSSSSSSTSDNKEEITADETGKTEEDPKTESKKDDPKKASDDNNNKDEKATAEKGKVKIPTKSGSIIITEENNGTLSVVANHSTIKDKKQICKYLTEAITSTDDPDILKQLLEMGVVEYIQQNEMWGTETKEITQIMKHLNSNDKFKEYSDYDGDLPVNDYMSKGFGFENDGIDNMHEALINVLNDYQSGKIDKDAALYVLNKLSDGDISNLVKLFRYGKGKDQEGDSLKALYMLMYEANFETDD